MSKEMVVVFLLASIALFLYSAIRVCITGRKTVGSGFVTSHQVAGYLFWQAADGWLNYILFPFVLALFCDVYGLQVGAIYGISVMIGVTLVSNVIYVTVNNATETDWSFMGWITHLRDCQSTMWPLRYARLLKRSKIGHHRLVRRLAIRTLTIVRKSFGLKIKKFTLANTLIFLYLSVWRDSFYAINFVYGKKTNLRKPKVLGLFLISHVMCNLAWAPFAGLIAVGGEFILRALSILW